MSTAKANTASGRIEEAVRLEGLTMLAHRSQASDTFVDVLEVWDNFVIPKS